MIKPTDRLWAAVSFAGVLASLTLQPLTTDASYLGASWVLIALVSAVAIIGHRLRVPTGLISAIQFLVALALLVSLSMALGDPDIAWWRRAGRLIAEGIGHMQVEAAPMSPNAGVRLILIALVGLLTLAAGLLADALERPTLSLAPLVTLYFVPALGLSDDLSVWAFAMIAIGYLAILYADGANTDRAWTRNLSADSARHGTDSSGVGRVALLVGTPALVLAAIVGLLLPTFVPFTISSIRANGSGPVQMSDPQIDLRRALIQGDNRPVLTYTTDKPDGAYLRLTSLTQITQQGWGLPANVNLKQGALGAVPGLAAAPPGSVRATQIEIGDFRSEYLPLPYAPRAQSARGDWTYDPASLTVMAIGTNRTRSTEGQKYTVQSWDIEPDGLRLSAAGVGTPVDSQGTTALPGDVPQPIVALTNRVTAGITAPALKAAAIQKFLRSEPFSYSTAGQSGSSGYQVLEAFLLNNHTGYCTQYASAMGLMARIAGIPSRVTIGFLPGLKSGDRWVVNSHDMHAWPELYFAGEGWVRFEPTPAIAVPPAWSIEAPNQTAPASSEPEPSLEPSVNPSDEVPTDEPSVVATGDGATVADILRQVLAVVLGLGAVVAIASVPGLLRARTRRSRLADGQDAHAAAAGAWAEIRDTWRDLGEAWPNGTPRQIAAQVVERLPDDGARDALGRITDAVERSRYAQAPGVVELTGDVRVVIAGLTRNLTWDGRLVQRWWPRSLWHAAGQWWDGMASRFLGDPS